MKKKTLIILSLISIIAFVFGSASAPMTTKSVKLIETRFVQDKGVVFLF